MKSDQNSDPSKKCKLLPKCQSPDGPAVLVGLEMNNQTYKSPNLPDPIIPEKSGMLSRNRTAAALGRGDTVCRGGGP